MTVLHLWTHDPNPITMRRPIDARADYWAYCLWCDTLGQPRHTPREARQDDHSHRCPPMPPEQPTKPRRVRDRRSGNGGHFEWTAEKDRIVAQLDIPTACRVLGASENQVSWRRRVLGLTKRHGRPWTTEEDEVVATRTTTEAAELLGRSASSVANRRYKLKKEGNDGKKTA